MLRRSITWRAIEVELPDGPRVRFTLMHEQFEVEFMVPLDEGSEAVAGAMFGTTKGQAAVTSRRAGGKTQR